MPSVKPVGQGMASISSNTCRRYCMSGPWLNCIGPPSCRLAGLAEWEQQVDEALRCRLGFMVGQPWPLIGLDDHVIGLVDGWHQQIHADHRDVQSTGSGNGAVAQGWVQLIGDIHQGAAGV